MYFVLYHLRSLCKRKSRKCLRKATGGSAYIGNHVGFAIATKTIFQEIRQFGISIWNVYIRVFTSKGVNDIANGGQTSVDISCFFQPISTSTRKLLSLRTRQIDDMKLTCASFSCLSLTNCSANYRYGTYAMTS